MTYTVLRPVLAYFEAEIEANNEKELIEKISKLKVEDYQYPCTDSMDIDMEWDSLEVLDENGNYIIGE